LGVRFTIKLSNLPKIGAPLRQSKSQILTLQTSRLTPPQPTTST
jgi:hypothetical protein